MNGIIVYNSKTGFTKQYAEWLSEELEIETIPQKKFKGGNYDYVIFGGRMIAGSITGLKKVWETISNDTKLFIFAVGALPMELESVINDVWEKNKLNEKTPHFYFQGGMDFHKMSFSDKTMIKAFSRMLEKSESKNEMEEAMFNAMKESFDGSNREYILPLVEAIKKEFA